MVMTLHKFGILKILFGILELPLADDSSVERLGRMGRRSNGVDRVTEYQEETRDPSTHLSPICLPEYRIYS